MEPVSFSFADLKKVIANTCVSFASGGEGGSTYLLKILETKSM